MVSRIVISFSPKKKKICATTHAPKVQGQLNDPPLFRVVFSKSACNMTLHFFGWFLKRARATIHVQYTRNTSHRLFFGLFFF